MSLTFKGSVALLNLNWPDTNKYSFPQYQMANYKLKGLLAREVADTITLKLLYQTDCDVVAFAVWYTCSA